MQFSKGSIPKIDVFLRNLMKEVKEDKEKEKKVKVAGYLVFLKQLRNVKN